MEMPWRLPGLGCWGKHFRNARETARTGILGRQNFYETLKTKETARTGVLGETLQKCLGDCQDWNTWGNTSEMAGRLRRLGYWGQHFGNAWETARTGVLGETLQKCPED